MGYGIPVEPDMENSTTLGIAIPRSQKKIFLEGDSAPLVLHLCRTAPYLQMLPTLLLPPAFFFGFFLAYGI